MRSTPHILVIHGTKVRRPVFVLGAPHSGADLVARALKRSPGFHLTAGRPSVLRNVYAFARRPQIAADSQVGAARVLRDAYAEAWQVSARACAECPPECRELAGLRLRPGATRAEADRAGPCVPATGLTRFADASPDLIYCADVILDAFPDAQLVQVIRDGRDAVADMLVDERCLAWFKPALANLETVFPNAFLGVEELAERDRWHESSAAVKCALRWRGSVRLSARLRAQTPAEQLFTVRYEDLVAEPSRTAGRLADYLEAPVSTGTLAGLVRPREREAAEPETGVWRERLTPRQLGQVEKVAGAELERLGYRLSGGG
ncbi:sulfotransferase family protein [Actinomadura parmotrematis]|uniref:Sulfotransferase n=1 Tax=Actinomadura parmotrematis TaxID=2864039 RepID=A0ABS7FSC0_9ACTN|nr:sulfotransferase [Actinomadura parmotrematis]MBW8483304.1 sulfotransferase [Actinomadura parmotrematis]